MSFDRPKHGLTSIDKPAPSNQRVIFLEVLCQVLEQTWGVSAGVVLREGCQVLFVVNSHPARRSVEIGCDFTKDGWHYSWADDSRTISPVEDTAGAAEVIIGYLRAAAQR